MNDDQIWELARSGDEQMFKELVGRYERPLFGFLVRRTGDPSRAEDLFQEIFMIIHKSRHKYYGGGHFRSWLYTIALNLIRSRARRAKKEIQLRVVYSRVQDDAGQVLGVPGEILPDQKASKPVEAASRSEETQQIQEAIKELPEDHRNIVILRIYQQLSFEEIARVTGEAVGTLKSRMFYALKKLRPKLMQVARNGGYLK